MRKEKLTGTLEEQCTFLYQLAREKMAQGNFAGAYHALKEILKHVPDHADAATLLTYVERKKKEQRQLLLIGLLGGVLFVGFGTFFQLSNDLIFILLAIIGIVVGFFIGNLWLVQRRKEQPPFPDSVQ